ncbi:DarT ssDNA thymidine ADP-ribosyltransferase family protein [Pseudoalteromonas peptidolytica]|uniref:DarT domain-containing protein n=1 Tax=Pseudoalteromonas peptidolytica F12-50-A1 TaxID=1315280 RepID=A0A8I0MWS1_9GAMM|nr:DarT ssDNA thymidine ADP-ribosyltransferase family protein [Pseudoalteromonas peptidolytica]MBE0347362.1 hypothetical protein [Pseudoalteromonas peptidolytica F12-50-A1]
MASLVSLCDAQIGVQNTIKQRCLTELTLSSYPDLFVGQCVPFYFCPRSIMLYVIDLADGEELVDPTIS